MARRTDKNSRFSIRKRISNIEKKIEQTLEKTFEVALKTTLEKAVPAATAAQNVAQNVAQTAADRAKQGLDQVLLGLKHKGLDPRELKDSDLVQSVGRKVLERAEKVREQVANQPYSPAWLKDISFAKADGAQDTDANVVDATVGASTNHHTTDVVAADAVDAEIAQDAAATAVEVAAKASAEAAKAAETIGETLNGEPVVDVTSRKPTAEAAGSVTDATISEPAAEMQPDDFATAEKKAKAKKRTSKKKSPDATV